MVKNGRLCVSLLIQLLSLAIYIIKLNPHTKIIKIGRGHDMDIRISDISVSRVHSLLHINMQ